MAKIFQMPEFPAKRKRARHSRSSALHVWLPPHLETVYSVCFRRLQRAVPCKPRVFLKLYHIPAEIAI